VLRIEIVFSMKLTPGMAAMLVRRRQSDARAGANADTHRAFGCSRRCARESRDELGWSASEPQGQLATAGSCSLEGSLDIADLAREEPDGRSVDPEQTHET
jgi:hypothetical protein